MGRKSKWIFFFHKKYTDGQQAHGKMLNITPYWGDAHQNHSEISPHIWQNGYPTKYYRQQMKVWRKGNPCALLMGMSIDTTAMENDTEVLKQNTIYTSNKILWNKILSYDPLLNNFPRKTKTWKIYMHPCVHVTLIDKKKDTETTWIPINRWMD